jgi:hypothetical protein
VFKECEVHDVGCVVSRAAALVSGRADAEGSMAMETGCLLTRRRNGTWQMFGYIKRPCVFACGLSCGYRLRFAPCVESGVVVGQFGMRNCDVSVQEPVPIFYGPVATSATLPLKKEGFVRQTTTAAAPNLGPRARAIDHFDDLISAQFPHPAGSLRIPSTYMIHMLTPKNRVPVRPRLWIVYTFVPPRSKPKVVIITRCTNFSH